MSEPLISIGVVTYNRAWCIDRVLQAIYVLDYPKSSLRLILVDNASSDNTVSLLRGFEDNHRDEYEDVRVVERGRHDKEDIAEGRSLCIDNSDGDYFVSLDSDAVMAPETLQRMLEFFGQYDKLGEVQFLAQEPKYPSRGMELIVKMYVSKEPKQPYFGWTGGMHCVGVRMDLAKSLRFRNLGKATDEDFHFRLRSQGYKILIDPVCRAGHLKQEGAGGTGPGYFRYLFSYLPKFHVPLLFSKPTPRRQILRLLLYWGLILGIILLPIWPWLLAAALVIMMVAEFVKASGIYRIVNALLYPVFGIIYGAGMFVGIVRYLARGSRTEG